jgi:hypothetical protein
VGLVRGVESIEHLGSTESDLQAVPESFRRVEQVGSKKVSAGEWADGPAGGWQLCANGCSACKEVRRMGTFRR